MPNTTTPPPKTRYVVALVVEKHVEVQPGLFLKDRQDPNAGSWSRVADLDYEGEAEAFVSKMFKHAEECLLSQPQGDEG